MPLRPHHLTPRRREAHGILAKESRPAILFCTGTASSPRTEGAIRDFERAASLTPSASLSEALLHAIMRSPVRRENVHPARTAVAGPSVSEGVIRPPPTPSLAQVLAVQRALSEFGYGQIRPTGTIDPDTQRAIAEFEHERNLPISGQLSERLIRELSAATRRTLH
jgi:peptidoglycan hydrolase-like protein with peptidoglycan-binding domain